jgi:MFS family permease
VEAIPDPQFQAGLHSLVMEGVHAQIVGALTGGVLLVGFALSLGASNFVIGLLPAVPFLAQLAQIPAIMLIEKVRRRRPVTVIASVASRLLLLPLAFLPFFGAGPLSLGLLILGIAAHAGLGAVAACSWNSWMHDLIPDQMLGSFFGNRLFYATAFAMIAGLFGGGFVDVWAKLHPQHAIFGYMPLFLLAAAAGGLSSWYLSRVPEPPMLAPERKVNLRHMVAEAFHDPNFRRLLVFLGSWNFAVNLAAPFFAVYLVQELHFEIAFVTVLMVISQLANMLCLRQWGRLSDRFSNKTVLAVCAPLFLLCILAWTYTALPERHALTVPLLFVIHIAMGISSAGITLASGNICLKLAPQGRATAFLATSSMVNSLAAGIAPILGGLFADDFASREIALLLRWSTDVATGEVLTLKIRHWDFFFGFAFIIGLYALHRLSMIREEGEVREKILVQEMMIDARRTMQNLSPIAGLRILTTFPFGQLLHNARRKRMRPRT